jgi:7-carboxy-7-deazaguanine synthase
MPNLVEIFASAQGEGPYVGRSTVFVRFGECDLRCLWCDSPGTWKPAAECRVERSAGSGDFETLANPVSVERALAAIDALRPSPASDVSLTGGEPLLQPDDVAALAGGIRERGMRVYLETHGLAVAALERVVDTVDFVSMDWKLESDVRWADKSRRGTPGFGELHERFLRTARAGAEVYVKVVVTPNTRPEEIDALCARIAAVDPAVPLVLQPVTPMGGVKTAPEARAMLETLWRCEARLPDVRLIPQTHRSYGAL